MNEPTAERVNEATAERVNDLIYHLALASDWEAAQVAGDYRVSTRGVTLEQEGFIHASRADQWEDVRTLFYADLAESLLLLVIDADRLAAPLVVEPVPGTDDVFPHIYGPLNLDAVIETRELTE